MNKKGYSRSYRCDNTIVCTTHSFKYNYLRIIQSCGYMRYMAHSKLHFIKRDLIAASIYGTDDAPHHTLLYTVCYQYRPILRSNCSIA